LKVLICNLHFNGLSLAREFGRRGFSVLGLDCVRGVGAFSRYVRFHQCPSPAEDEKAFITFLLDLGKSQGERMLIFPVNDDWASAIARHKDQLEEFYALCVADGGVVDLLLSKSRFYEWAEKRGYPVPRTWSLDQWETIPETEFPLVAKPECRLVAGQDSTALTRLRRLNQNRLTILHKREDVKTYVETVCGNGHEILLQQFVRGLSDCMFTVGIYADRQHRIRGMFCGRKVRGYPSKHGDCMVGQIEDVPEEIKDLVQKMTLDLQFHGIAEFEFKRDEVSGCWFLIEVNPRSWSWIGITPACGVNLPWIAYRDLVLQDLEDDSFVASTAATGSVKWVRLWDDLLNCMLRYRMEGNREWSLSFVRWWRSLKADRLVLAEWAWDDPVPGIVALWLRMQWIGRGVSGKLRRFSSRRTEPRT